ncbi:DUF885 domain-containing protein [Larkinella soli]|uniref:DUF885 domain-containing protein n=1 Tax=Larkinella soli TaxID=1770527 RepID=UPI000FFBDC07|nr:DUF885 domain-containing protein [Larkinella soli]
MVRRLLVLLILLTAGALAPVPVCAQTAKTAAPGLKAVLAAYDQFQKREFPNEATGRTAFPLGSFTEADFERRNAFFQEQLQKLKQIDPASLSLDGRITHQLLRFVFTEEVDSYRFKAYLNPILVDDGFHIAFARLASGRFSSVREYDAYLRKLRAFPAYVRQHIDLMRRGLALGIAQPAVILEGYETTWQPHIVEKPEESVFWAAFERMPVTVAEPDRSRLLAEGRRAIADSVVNGYRLIKTFFETEYLPKAPRTVGVSHWPQGKEYYEERVRYFSTLPMTARQVHELGLKEVARIRSQMDSLIRKVEFKGSFKEFLNFLRTDPRFYARTPRELLKEASFIAKAAEAKLPAFFGKLPRQPFGVEPVPDYLAPKYTAGRYSPAPAGSRNAGFFWVNTYNLKSRPLYVLESLALHEAVPGHHLQIALTQEMTDLTPFRRRLYVNAFGEGWALYTEYLGREMGFYQDPYADFGRLTYEMWRACRLVVDTGLHAFGWTRDQALNYLTENTALSLLECRTETDRYISWPGQALSYKIGELKIRELRAKAEKALGTTFDIREFHDTVLSQGTLTMPALELLIDDYIRRKTKPTAAGRLSTGSSH